MVQETKWTFDGNWSTPHYHFTHSAGEAKEDRVGGVLIMLSTKVVPRSADIQFHAVHPGRLLHIRINRKQPIDVLNLYQCAANDNKLTPERHHKFLLRLRHTLQDLPTRKTLIIGGDLNTTCTRLRRSVESGSCQPPRLTTRILVISWPFCQCAPSQCSTRGTDQLTGNWLPSLLDSWPLRLTILSADRGKQHTAPSKPPSYSSSPWLRGGFPSRSIVGPRQSSPRYPNWTLQLIADLRQPTPSPALQAFREGVLHGIQRAQWSDLRQLEQGVLNLAQEHYPLRPSDVSDQRTEDMQLANCARRMEHASSPLHRAGSGGSGNNFRKHIENTNNVLRPKARRGNMTC